MTASDESRPSVTGSPPALMSQVARQDTLTLNARLSALLVECGEHERSIYRGDGVPPCKSLPFLSRVARLIDGLCGVTSIDTYDDVIEALEDAV